MDSYRYIDNIQVEKANALARYNRFNNISKVLRLVEVFIAVALISWSSTRLRTVFKVFGEYLYACSCYMLNQHVVFLVGNVIVIICYILSSNNNSNSNSNSNSDVENLTARPVFAEDVRYKYISNSDGYKSSVTAKTASNIGQLIDLPQMKQTVKEENNNNNNKEVMCEKTNVKTTKSEEATETVVKQAAKQIERFKRTQSVKLRQEMTVKPRGELRRSVTERRRSVVTADDGCSTPSSVETVERLSNEEFRLRVEAFISKQQSLLKQQSMV